MTEQEIKNFVAGLNLKVSELPDARFMDQKCIPDVVCAVAECVLEYDRQNPGQEFSRTDIWFSKYAQELITTSFSKPNLNDETARKEYDKFFGQPLRLLAYAGVLNLNIHNSTNYYTIVAPEVLEYISLRERNALVFLNAYLEKLINDNNLMVYFDNFFHHQDNTTLAILCNKLDHFFWDNTSVQNQYEPPRIYNKIINIFAKCRGKKGISRGHLSRDIITFSEIRYNTTNWRDINKAKNMTRQSYRQMVAAQAVDPTSYFHYRIEKAKKFVRKVENDCSEVHRFLSKYSPTQAHHIFMASEFPELADCPENIICLTPTQHFTMAHPNNRTALIDPDYQIVCLLSKLDSIEINFRNGKDDYSLIDFINVLNTGLNIDYFTSQMDFEEVKYGIIKKAYYHDLD